MQNAAKINETLRLEGFGAATAKRIDHIAVIATARSSTAASTSSVLCQTWWIQVQSGRGQSRIFEGFLKDAWSADGPWQTASQPEHICLRVWAATFMTKWRQFTPVLLMLHHQLMRIVWFVWTCISLLQLLLMTFSVVFVNFWTRRPPPDLLPTYWFKQITVEVAPYLMTVFYHSLAGGRFPLKFKQAIITSDSQDQLGSRRRPITPASKLCHFKVAHQLTAYIQNNDILPSFYSVRSKQKGFLFKL